MVWNLWPREEGMTVSRARQMVSRYILFSWHLRQIESSWQFHTIRPGILASESTLADHFADTLSTAPSYSDSIITPSYTSPVSTANIDASSLSLNIGSHSRERHTVPVTMPTTCSTCGEAPPMGDTLSRCSRCKRAFYCSKACQTRDWRDHKPYCQQVEQVKYRPVHFHPATVQP